MGNHSMSGPSGRIWAALRKRPFVPLTAIAVVLFAAAALLYGGGRTPLPQSISTEAVPIGGPFQLVGPNGETITEKSFPGKWTLVFFGYTFCPDVCPTTLIDIGKAMAALGPKAAQVQPLFITVDPKRDTPQVLKDYTAHFDARIMGLTGSQAAIDQVLDAYRVYAAARPAEDGGPVLFDHSAIIYLMTPSGHYGAHFTVGMSGEEMAKGIEKAMNAKTGETG